MPLTPDIDLAFLTKATKGYSGADIQAMCNEAAMNAVRRNDKTVTLNDFKKAMDGLEPTITPEMEAWYKGVAQQFRKQVKPATPIV